MLKAKHDEILIRRQTRAIQKAGRKLRGEMKQLNAELEAALKALEES